MFVRVVAENLVAPESQIWAVCEGMLKPKKPLVMQLYGKSVSL